jgi:cytochrome c
VTDQAGRTVSDYVEITAGQRPVVELTVTTDANGFQFGDTVQYSVTVNDDQPVDCNEVSVTYILGHNTHGHPQTTAFGCSGSITTTVPGGHDPATDDLSAVFDATYTDPGQGNLPPLTGTDQVVLEPTG